jgi:hypothetical protein
MRPADWGGWRTITFVSHRSKKLVFKGKNSCRLDTQKVHLEFKAGAAELLNDPGEPIAKLLGVSELATELW